MRPNGLNDTPQFKINIDREGQCAGHRHQQHRPDLLHRLGIVLRQQLPRPDNRIKKVYAQGDARFRMNPDDLSYWYVRNAAGTMVPFSAFSSGQWIYGSPKLERYNGIPAVEIQGAAAPASPPGRP